MTACHFTCIGRIESAHLTKSQILHVLFAQYIIFHVICNQRFKLKCYKVMAANKSSYNVQYIH